jgi:hypothetical protein
MITSSSLTCRVVWRMALHALPTACMTNSMPMYGTDAAQQHALQGPTPQMRHMQISMHCQASTMPHSTDVAHAKQHAYQRAVITPHTARLWHMQDSMHCEASTMTHSTDAAHAQQHALSGPAHGTCMFGPPPAFAIPMAPWHMHPSASLFCKSASLCIKTTSKPPTMRAAWDLRSIL